MKHKFSTSGALRARTRALCALTLALLVSAAVSAQDWGTEATTGSGINVNAAFASVTMNVTTVGATKRVQLNATQSGKKVWLALVVDGTLSVSSIDDIPVGTYTITNTGAAGTALASQGLSGSDIIGTGGYNTNGYFHATGGTAYVFDDNTDDHHHLIHLRATEFHQTAMNDPSGRVKAQFFPSGSRSDWAYAQTVTTCGTGTVSGTGVSIGTDRTFTATPDGTTFSYWVDGDGNLVSTDNPVTFTAWGPAELKAVFSDGVASCPAAGASTPTYTITWVDGDGNEIYHETVDEGETPAFDNSTTPTKTQTDEYTYAYNSTWSPAPYAADKDQVYTAQFDATKRQYTITVTSAGNGTVTGGGTYDYGTVVSLTATPDTYYQFGSWSDSGAQNHSVTVTGTASYTATFSLSTATLQIADNGAASYYSTILAAYGSTATDICLNRTFKAGMWNTVCFPFDLTAAQRTNSDMSGVTFYTLTSVTGDAAVGLDFNVTAVTTETLSARTPYLVQFTGADIVNPVFEDVTLAASAFTNNTSGTNVGETSFFGTVHPTSLEIGENSGYLFLGQNNSLYWPNVNNDIRAFRAYFYSGNSTVQAVRPRARIVVKDQTATGNSGISGNSGTSGESARKYLHNGVLVIERDGVKYNAVGQPIE